MAFRDFFPFQQATKKKGAQLLNLEDKRVMAKIFRNVGLAIGYTGGSMAVTSPRASFEPIPYDLERIIQAVDTDSYVKQAFNKYSELMWKESWDISSENSEALDYLHQRIDFFELAMGQTFQNFLVEVADQLFKFSNCIIVKVRNESLREFFPYHISREDNKAPIVGYQIIPAETVEALRDYKNKVKWYRQNIWGSSGAGTGFNRGDGTNLIPTWNADEVIHLYIDKRPGRVFGTPFLVSVMDDVVGLRQLEEDIQNLVHRELFPFYLYKVGTEDHPAEPEEVEQAAAELAQLRNEGGLVLPDRHEVEVLGAQNAALDAQPYLDHFKERVCVGLGLSPHHLGMMMAGGNRSVTERLDIALYDKIKMYQRYLSGMIQLKIFDEILLEGGFDPYVTPSDKSMSDRCLFKFNEIDVDTQVKKENHILQKWQSDIIEESETRVALGYRPEMNEDEVYTALSQRLLPSPGKPITPANTGSATATPAKPADKAPVKPGQPPNKSQGGLSNVPNKPDSVRPSGGGIPNKSITTKGVSNKSKPANQFGRRLSPNITHSEEWLEDVINLLDEEEV